MNNEDPAIRIKGGNVKKSFELLSQAAEIISELPEGSDKDQSSKMIMELAKTTQLQMEKWLLKKSLKVENQE